MTASYTWAWDDTNKVWRKILVDTTGRLLTMAVIDHLDDIGDVSVASPTDQYLLYWDAATSLWKCKALTDSDIPAAIARDTEVATAVSNHAGLPDVHHVAFVAADHTAIGNGAPHHAEAHTLTSHSTKAHSELTGVGASDHHVRYADSEALAAAWANINTKSLVNLLDNGSFEVGDPPTGWTLVGAGATLARSTEQVKVGTYSAKLTRVTNDCGFFQALANYAYYKERVVTLGCWVYATGAGRARLLVYDGISGTYSAYHSGTPGWEWLTAIYTVNAGASYLWAYLQVSNDDTSAYFGGAMLVEGDSCPAFSPKPSLSVLTKTDTGDPSGAEEGRIYINTFDNVVKIYADGAWRTIASW